MAFLPTTVAEAEKWVDHYDTELDALNTERIASLFSSEAVIQLSKDRAIEGREVIRAFFKENFTMFEATSHVPETVELDGNTISVKLSVSYKIKGDPEDKVLNNPSFLVIGLVPKGEEKGLIQIMEAKHDLSPIFERMKFVKAYLAQKDAA